MGFIDGLLQATDSAFLGPAAYQEGFADGKEGRPRAAFFMRSNRTDNQREKYDQGYKDGQQARLLDAMENR